MAITKQDKPSGSVTKEDKSSGSVSKEDKSSDSISKENRPKSPRIGKFDSGRFGFARFDREEGYEKLDKETKPTATITKEDKPS